MTRPIGERFPEWTKDDLLSKVFNSLRAEAMRLEKRADLCDRIDAAVEKRIKDRAAQYKALQDENNKLRAALGNSQQPCVYCDLSAADMAKCTHGFPGCPRADDANLCPHIATAMRSEQQANNALVVAAEFRAQVTERDKAHAELIELYATLTAQNKALRAWVGEARRIGRSMQLADLIVFIELDNPAIFGADKEGE